MCKLNGTVCMILPFRCCFAFQSRMRSNRRNCLANSGANTDNYKKHTGTQYNNIPKNNTTISIENLDTKYKIYKITTKQVPWNAPNFLRMLRFKTPTSPSSTNGFSWIWIKHGKTGSHNHIHNKDGKNHEIYWFNQRHRVHHQNELKKEAKLNRLR